MDRKFEKKKGYYYLCPDCGTEVGDENDKEYSRAYRNILNNRKLYEAKNEM